MWSCYCLIRADSGASYVGATVDMSHRIRQHNCEIKGGAKYTSSAVAAGHTWKILCTVGGFPDSRAALQFEWKWKALTAKKGVPALKRVHALITLLNSERSTSTAEPFASYEPLRVEIHWRRPETELLATGVQRGVVSHLESTSIADTSPAPC
jgi:structure-specific endonuclease subunit SLX1